MPTFASPPTTATRLTWALWWAGRGWAVFPVCSPEMGPHLHNTKEGIICDANNRDFGKRPMLGGGFKTGTVNRETIEKWWSKWPDANIGATPPEDHFVVDIDGETDVEFPDTWEHTTGKGTHKVYRQNITKPAEQTNPQNAYWPNVDTRVSGKGYIVLPPSTHRSGAVYTLVSQATPTVFPAELLPDRSKSRRTTKSTAETSPALRLLSLPRDADQLGDDAMSVVAGYLARYIPDREHWAALLGAINAGLSDPLSDQAMSKKDGIWEKHQQTLANKEAKELDDEARGWLFELGEAGYSTPIETRESVDYMPWSDFRVQAKGLVIEPDNQVWIVDFTRADGSVLENQRLSTHVMASTSRLREWLLGKGMVLHDHAADKRKHAGGRLMKLLQSQDAPVLMSRDHYGWCDQTSAFLTMDGEVTAEGLRPFTEVYPEDRLRADAPTVYRWDCDLDQARSWLTRVLALQAPTETMKIGSWLMMLFLRGQWSGRLPGILVDASAGSGKTLFFQLLSKLAGVQADGEELTHAVARDMLSANSSGFIWLDDVATKEDMQQLIRKAMTQGSVRKKTKVDGADWTSKVIPLRASAIISGEGTDWFRQKAMRDRFIDVRFTLDETTRTPDADKLSKEDLGAASGVLLQEALKHAHLLADLDAELKSDVVERDRQAQAVLRMGSRILDLVLSTGDHYSAMADAWFNGDSEQINRGHASENVLEVFPSLWSGLGYPHQAGQHNVAYPIWYDEISATFWIAGKRAAEAWNERRNVSSRQRQLTDYAAIQKELDACGATVSKNKKIPGSERGTVSYRQLPKRYSDMVLANAGVELGEHTLED